MALDDYVESEVAIAVAATVAVLSPPVRRVLRQGAVYGLAGVIMAGDAIGAFARGIGRGARQAATGAQETMQTAAATARGPDGQPAAANQGDAATAAPETQDAADTQRRTRRTRETEPGE